MVEKVPQKADINLSSKEELVAINGIGESLAQKIIDYRPYSTLKDLVRVPGISEAKLAALVPFLKAQKLSKKASAESPAKGTAEGSLGHTETFVFLDEPNDRQDALLIIFGGFILGLILLLLRRRD